MNESASQYAMNYRQEILTPIFNFIKSSESFYVIGGASMGKTRLLDYLTTIDVQRNYLGNKADKCWLIRVDMNRLSVKEEAWALYELLLSSLVLEMGKHGLDDDTKTKLLDLSARVIESKDLLMALRFFEMAVNGLCHDFDLKLCFLLDEFDEAYMNLSKETFAQLRAVRDANKRSVLYGVFLRNLPERLRQSPDNESFYELLSRNMLGLGPYSREDTRQILQNLEKRRNYDDLTPVIREQLYEASGGHIGLIQSFLGILIEDKQAIQKVGTPGWMEEFGRRPVCIEECRKIWEGLAPDEREGLSTFLQEGYSQIQPSSAKLLTAMGLLRQVDEESYCMFSPVFEQYVRGLN